jgi:hypothetical protein
VFEEILRRLEVRDPVALAAAGALALAIVLLLARLLRGGRARAGAAEPPRSALLRRTREIREAAAKAKARFAPVLAEVQGEGRHARVLGHARSAHGCRFGPGWRERAVLSALARAAGADAAPFAEVDAVLRKMASTFEAFDAGRLDADPTPVATALGIQRDLDRLALLADIAGRSAGAGG